MFDLRLQVVIYPEREWNDRESRPQQPCLLFCGLNTYRLQSCALVDNPLHESPRHLNHNFNSEFFNRFVSLKLSELPGMSSSVKNERTRHKVVSKGHHWECCSPWPSMPRFRATRSTQTILGRRHFGIRCITLLQENNERISFSSRF